MAGNQLTNYMLSSNLVTRVPSTAPNQIQNNFGAQRPAAPSPTEMVSQFESNTLGRFNRPAEASAQEGLRIGGQPAQGSAVRVAARGVGDKISASNSRLRTLALAKQQRDAQMAAAGPKAASGTYTYSGPQKSMVDKSAPASGLVDVGNGKQLRSDAGSNFNRMNAAFKAAFGTQLSVTAGYRSNARQAELYALYKAGKGNLAAPPGKSLHQQGTAVDIGNYGGSSKSKQFQWLLQNAHRFGFSWDNGRRYGEPWHWEYVG